MHIISLSSINILKHFYYSRLSSLSSLQTKYNFFLLSRQFSLMDPLSNQHNKNINYVYNWLSMNKIKSITDWQSVTDQINGGESKGEIYYYCDDKIHNINNRLVYKGYVETKDKDKMIHYPFINLQKRIAIGFKIGGFKLLQIQIKTDGKPVQVHLTVSTFIKGDVNIYGFIVSKSKQWHTYELPIQNMILRGTQQDYHEGGYRHDLNNQFLSKKSQSSIFDKQFQSTKKIIQSETNQQDGITIKDIGFRLVSSVSQNRQIQIRNVNLAYKKGYQNFVKEYMNPYFYIVQNNIDKQKKQENNIKIQRLQFIHNTLENVHLIDTGDVKYYSKTNKNKNKKINISERVI